MVVSRWLAETFPAICARAKCEGGVVLWLDEMGGAQGVRSDAAAGPTWAPAGQTPTVPGPGRRFGVNFISAISNAWVLRFSVFARICTADVVVAFLTRLVADLDGRKVHLILNNHPVRRSNRVGERVDQYSEVI